MIIGITGNPLTNGVDGKTTAAKFICDNLPAAYVDLMAPIQRMMALIGEQGGYEEQRNAINKICIIGRKVSPNYWLNMSLKSVAIEDKDVVLDNVFFYNEYVFIKKHNGIIIQVTRDGLKQDLEFTPDFVILASNLTELQSSASSIIAKIK